MLTQKWPGGNTARDAYDGMAGAYDDYNHGYMYERWTQRLLDAALTSGLSGDRLLDVGCGTGLSLLPMLDRGWTAIGCDVSEGMLRRAREKIGNKAELLTLDMRDLPVLGEFDLVWAVNDALNYLLGLEELRAALFGMRRNLALGGAVVFDVNALRCIRDFWGSTRPLEFAGRRFVWTGEATRDVAPGATYQATFQAEDEPQALRTHVQRHFPEAEIIGALRDVGFQAISVFGEKDGALSPGLDEDFHTKAVYVAMG